MKRFLFSPACRVILSVLFTILLIGSILCGIITVIFDATALTARLEQQAFTDFATAQLTEKLSSLQGIIAVDFTQLQKAVAAEQIRPILQDYIRQVNATVFSGAPAPAQITYQHDDIYALVCEVITKEQYGNDTAQMKEDRQAAYADLTAAVSETLSFFPQTLYNTADQILQKAGISLPTLYTFVSICCTLTYILIPLTILTAVGIVFCSKQKQSGLLIVGGCGFLTASVYFLSGVFMRDFSLINRLSLSDGLLRRYILAMMQHIGDASFITVTIVFVLFTLLLAGAIIWRVYSTRNNTCKVQETVVE